MVPYRMTSYNSYNQIGQPLGTTISDARERKSNNIKSNKKNKNRKTELTFT